MAIKIRCQDCGKKISIDEAFAGSTCRCPYCKALVYVAELVVGGGGEVSGGARPVAPTSRPDTREQAAPAGSQARASAAAGAAADGKYVPMARPVRIHGIITIVIFVLLAFMVGAVIALAVLVLPGSRDTKTPNTEGRPTQIDNMPDHEKGPDKTGKTPDKGKGPDKTGTTPDKGKGPDKTGKTPDNGKEPDQIGKTPEQEPAVLDIKITPPVFYVLDGGSGMRWAFDSVVGVMLKSAESLGNGKFNVIVAGESQDMFVEPDMAVGGKDGATKCALALQETIPTGAANIPRALKAAIDRKPKAVVLFTRKAVDDAMSLAQQAKAQGTVIHTIAVDADNEVNESLKRLAEAAGGQTTTFSTGLQ